MTKLIQDFRVLKNLMVATDFFILDLFSSQSLPEILPGQFVQMRVDNSPETFLRRPFSVYDIDYQNNTLRLLVQIVGKGTETLSKLTEGDTVNLVYPLGNSFTKPVDGEKIIFIAGGVGIAPFLFFAKNSKSTGCEVNILFGFRSGDRIPDLSEFRELGDLYITTEDGSKGERGFVTDHSVLREKQFDRIYSCGPDPMMKAVAGYARSSGIECEVSLENVMACGFGICLCCIEETTRGNLCVCSEGPVFNIKELKW
jgi:dihydroorotate dehydrogenase electron transfer subunit